MKKIAFPDNEEPIPFNNNKGGMKALAEKQAGKRSAEASTSHAKANVFHMEAAEPEVGSWEFKKRLADKVREKTEWESPMLISSITVEVGAAWEANVDDKRKSDGTKGRKEKRRRDEAGTSTLPPPAPPPTPPPEPEKVAKPVNKTPRWILG
ncbi:unnamed protein product [Calypogeia fissa]